MTSMDEEEIKLLAAQLRKPTGKDGIETGKMMFKNNGTMIKRAIDLLSCAEGNTVLELGYGNGAHLDYLLSKKEKLQYIGVDISETMQKEAELRNQKRLNDEVASFLLGNGIDIPLDNSSVDKFFTVNTIYFWEDHPAVLKEIMRVLKSGGEACIALATHNFMQRLPFIKYGFRTFHPEETEDLLLDAGFTNLKIIVENERMNNDFQDVKERELIFALAQKPL